MTLRIQRTDEPEFVVFTLAGRIQADQIPELQMLLRSESSQNLVLDLCAVRLVDRDAVCFLSRIEEEGTKLRNCSAFIREWISRERSGMHRDQAEDQQSSAMGE